MVTISKQPRRRQVLSPSTVAWHMRRIYDKLHVHSKSEAVAKVLRERIV
jgi:DNA-binding CsgD family transcriptional regulator